MVFSFLFVSELSGSGLRFGVVYFSVANSPAIMGTVSRSKLVSVALMRIT